MCHVSVVTCHRRRGGMTMITGRLSHAVWTGTTALEMTTASARMRDIPVRMMIVTSEHCHIAF